MFEVYPPATCQLQPRLIEPHTSLPTWHETDTNAIAVLLLLPTLHC
jgi:hypothetical protein